MKRLRTPGVACASQTECPLAELSTRTQAWINRAPFFATSGTALAISSAANNRTQQAAFELFTYMAARSQANVDVRNRRSFSDPFRNSQLGDAALASLTAQGWESAEANEYLSTTSWALNHQNAALDLRVPGQNNYMSSVLNAISPFVHDNNGTAEEAAVAAGAAWRALPESVFQGSTSRAAKNSMLDLYRAQLGLPQIMRSAVDVLPCRITGCGRFAQCLDDGDDTTCTCSSSDTQQAADFATSRVCVPAVASTEQQRVFWTLSMFCFGVGFVLCLFVMNEFFRNPYLSLNGTMWTFAAIAIPDFVLSVTYFIFHFINLLNGEEMDAAPCGFFSFLTTMVVFATFCGPPIVASITFLRIYKLSKGLPISRSKGVVALALLGPWIFGALIAAWSSGDNMLGSYRGLLCYNKEWDSFSTGGITMTVFILSTVLTLICYVGTAVFARNALNRADRDEMADKSFKIILKRGIALVLTFFATWALFIVVVGISHSRVALPLNIEMVASLCLSLQPIIDTYLILSTEALRASMFERLYKTYCKTSRTTNNKVQQDTFGSSSASSSSSTASSSSSSTTSSAGSA
jgi:hypothetical protein